MANFLTASEFNENGYTHDTDIGENYIYISHLDDGLQYWRLPMWPDDISDQMSSTFNSTTALGRSAPVYTFSNAGPRVVQISLVIHRDEMDDVNMGWSNAKLGFGEDYIENLIHALQSIALPKYNVENKAVEPPLIALRLGNEVFVKGVLLNGVGVSYTKPILENNKYAQLKLSITIAEVDPYDASAVYKNGSFRGMVNSFKNIYTSDEAPRLKEFRMGDW